MKNLVHQTALAAALAALFVGSAHAGPGAKGAGWAQWASTASADGTLLQAAQTARPARSTMGGGRGGQRHSAEGTPAPAADGTVVADGTVPAPSSEATENHPPRAPRTDSSAGAQPVVVPAGSATYAGVAVGIVTDRSSGTAVPSPTNGQISLAVSFDGAGKTTQTGSISGLSGAGAQIGDLTIAGTGDGSRFRGTLSSTTWAAAGTGTSATGTGSIDGRLSAPVTTSTTPEAPVGATGRWNFNASSNLSVNGIYSAKR